MNIATSSENNLTLVTYNIFLWSDPETISQNILKIQKEGADIFCLQEVLRTKDKVFVGDLIQKKLGKDWKIEYLLGDKHNYLDHGLAIIWNSKKIQATQIRKINLPQHGEILPLFSFIKYITGFTNKVPGQRRALSIIFDFQGKRFQLITTHIDIVGGREHRLGQNKYIKDMLLNTEIKDYVICGDFNTTKINSKEEVKKILGIYGDGFSEVCSKIPWTEDLYDCPLAFEWLNKIVKYAHLHLKQKLDHIFVKGFIPLDVKRLDVKGSDHYPILAKIKF